MADREDNNRKRKKSMPTSTTSLGKRRTFKSSPAVNNQNSDQDQDYQDQRGRPRSRSPGGQQQQGHHHHRNSNTRQQQQQQQQQQTVSTMSNPRTSDYGSQASPLRVPTKPSNLVKVTVLGAAGGIGQPLSLLLMLHSEYIQHLALYDLVNIHGVGADLSHIDRQCKITTHLGQEELADAVRGASVIIVPAGLAQKPGMSRDDLFGSNSKIMYNLAKVCAQVAPQATLAIISNPVNSLVPLTCEVYARVLGSSQNTTKSKGREENQDRDKDNKEKDKDNRRDGNQKKMASPTGADDASPGGTTKSLRGGSNFEDCFRRIFGITTLDVVRASTFTSKSAFYKKEANGLFKDPASISVPVVCGHAGKTIIPLLSQGSPKIDKKRLLEDKATTSTLIESIQEAGIEVLNAKKGTGSATLSMAYAACKFTISLLRAQQGEQNIVECAYVRHREPYVNDLEYFSCPLALGKDGYVKALPLGKLLPFEAKMIEEGCKELRTSIAKGEDFAREQLSSEK